MGCCQTNVAKNSANLDVDHVEDGGGGGHVQHAYDAGYRQGADGGVFVQEGVEDDFDEWRD